MRLLTSLLLTSLICSCSTTGDDPAMSKGGPPAGLDQWECYLADPGARREDVFTLVDDVIVCSGKSLGYLYTPGEYQDFVLELDWRWPKGKDPGKGGVLFRMTGEHKIWPRSLEAQINAGDAGDFWGLGGYRLSGPEDRTRSVSHEAFGELTNVKKTENVEKPAGEWNHYEITAEGDRVVLRINGQVVNEAKGCDVTPGRICLTSEGSEIHFRNLNLRYRLLTDVSNR